MTLIKKEGEQESSGQNGGVGRNPLHSCTTKRRIPTNLKSINNQKCQKIKLHGTPTTKELKKQSTKPNRPVHQQRNMAQMKEQSKTPERELSNEDIANLSDGEFKVLVIKILTELIELGHKMKEQMKDTQSEIEQNTQGTNSDRKETRTKSNDLEQKEEINIQIEQNEETRLQNK